MKRTILLVATLLFSGASFSYQNRYIETDPGWTTGVSNGALYAQKVFATNMSNIYVAIWFACTPNSLHRPLMDILVSTNRSFQGGEITFRVRNTDIYNKIMEGKPVLIHHNFTTIFIDLSHDKQYKKLVSEIHNKCINLNVFWRSVNETMSNND